MKTDPALRQTREVRERISREVENDSRRLIEYYLEYQRKFTQRLRLPPKDSTAAEGASAASPDSLVPNPVKTDESRRS